MSTVIAYAGASHLGAGLVHEGALEVRPSRIPNAGRGLFARRRIDRRMFLGEYAGRKLVWSPGCFIGDYTMRFGGEMRNARHRGNLLRFINHCGIQTPNVVAVGFLFFAADRIDADEELIMDYGWDFPVDPSFDFRAYDFERVVQTVLRLGVGRYDLEYIYGDAAFAMLEHLLHEVGHALSLGVPVTEGVSSDVGARMESLPQHTRTANEATVLAATMRVLEHEALVADYWGQGQDQAVTPEQWLDATLDERGEVAALQRQLARFMCENGIRRRS